MGVKAFLESALQLVESHRRRLNVNRFVDNVV